jgi:hypothetical protein
MSESFPGVSVRSTIRVLAVLACCLGLSRTHAQTTSTITSVVVTKKPGKPDGTAMATVKGPTTVKGKVTVTEKTGRIASHALEACKIMGGQGALLLMSPEKTGEPNRLRYYDLDADKGRFLGNVPFATATITESNGIPWAFAISGTDAANGHPVTFVGNITALHGRLDGASEPTFTADSLSFQSATGPHELKTAQLLGLDAFGQIYTPTGEAHGSYLQFLPDGEAGTRTMAHRWLLVSRGLRQGDAIEFSPG